MGVFFGIFWECWGVFLGSVREFLVGHYSDILNDNIIAA